MKNNSLAYKMDEIKTNVDSIYLNQIRSIKLLSKEEEQSFFRDLREIERKIVESLLLILTDDKLNELLLLANEYEREDVIKEINYLVKHKKRTVGGNFINFILLNSSPRSWMDNVFNLTLEDKNVESKKKNYLRKWKNETVEKKHKFIQSNLRLVVMFASRYAKQYRFQTMSDMIQEGNLGLMKAVDMFDVEKNLKFSTYAVWWIRQSILRSTDDSEKIIRIPVNQLDLQRKIARTERKYYTQFGREPSESELVTETKEAKERIKKAYLLRTSTVLRLDNTMDDNEEETFHKILVDNDAEPLDDIIIQNEAQDQIKVMLTYLTPQESFIVKWRYGIDVNSTMTLKEIGELMDLSRERIRQIESRALRKLKLRMGNNEFFSHQTQNILFAQPLLEKQ